MQIKARSTHEKKKIQETAAVQPDAVQYISALIDKARNVQTKWAQFSFKRRKKAVQRMSGIIDFYGERIARTIAQCTGKTIFDALSLEVLPAAIAASYYAKAAHKFLKPKRIPAGNIFFSYKKSVLLHEPWGVVGIISPWNFPFGIAFHELATAIMSGNAVLLKLASLAQPLGYWFKRILMEAGVPNSLVHIVELPGAQAGPAFIKAGIDKLFLTGSVAIGQQLLRLTAKTLTPLCLELGGNDAMIVCKDADIFRAAHGALWAGCANTGHSCGGVERIYVHESIADEFTRTLSHELSKLRIGREKDFNVDIGAIATVSQFDLIKKHVDEAIAKGARIVSKIGKENREKLVYPVIIMTNVTPDMMVIKHETFGTVLPIIPFKDEEKVVYDANNTNYGLTASIWSCDIKRAKQLAGKLKAGAITINDHLMSHALPGTPWGGYKQSGVGRAHGEAGFLEMTQLKVVVNDLLHRMPKCLWWFPHSKKQYHEIRGISALLFGKGLKVKLNGIKKVFQLFIASFKK